MASRVTLMAAVLLLASSASAQDRLFLVAGEIGTSNLFGQVIGPTYPILSFPRVGGHRFAITDSAVVDLASGATWALPPGRIVAHDQARPRVFVSREDGVWAVDVLSAREIRVFSRQTEGLAACRHAMSADLLFCAYTRQDGQFDIYKSAPNGDAVLLVTLPMLYPVDSRFGELWAIAPDGARMYVLECTQPAGTWCASLRLVSVDAGSGAIESAATGMGHGSDLPRLALDEVRDRVFVTSDGDASVFSADLQLLASASFRGANSWQDVAVSPATGTLYVHSFAQSTYGSLSWLASHRADSYAMTHDRTVLPTTDRRMVLVTAPGAPRNLRADVAGRDVALSWTNIGAASDFVIDIGLAPGRRDLSIPVPGGEPRAAFADVPPGTYYVRVSGSNLIGAGRASQEIAVTVP